MNLANLLSVLVVLLLVLCGLVYFGFVAYQLLFRWKEEEADLIRKNGVQVLGVPLSALGSFAILIGFPAATDQPLETLSFKGLGMDFVGPSSAIVLWNLTFLVFVLAIRLTRNR